MGQETKRNETKRNGPRNETDLTGFAGFVCHYASSWLGLRTSLKMLKESILIVCQFHECGPKHGWQPLDRSGWLYFMWRACSLNLLRVHLFVWSMYFASQPLHVIWKTSDFSSG
jgi:hypothetical protein